MGTGPAPQSPPAESRQSEPEPPGPPGQFKLAEPAVPEREQDRGEEVATRDSASRWSLFTPRDSGGKSRLPEGERDRAGVAEDAGEATDTSAAGDLGPRDGAGAKDAGGAEDAGEFADAGKAGDAGSGDAGPGGESGTAAEPGKAEPAGNDGAAGAAAAAPDLSPPELGTRGEIPAEKPDTPSGDDGDGAGATPLDGEVTIVPGVPRYHRRGCILIRFLSDGDLETMTRGAAEAAGSVPCKACQPDKPVSDP